MARLFNTDMIAGLMGLVVTYVFYAARGANWSPLSAQWPNAILVFMAIVSLALIVKAVVAAAPDPIFDEGNPLRMVWAMGLLVAWVLLLPRLGYILTSVLMFYAMWFVVGQGVLREENDFRQFPVLSHLRAIAIAAALAVASHWLFSRILFVPLPRGPLGW